jgi:uncharacterized protein (DUF488 family)
MKILTLGFTKKSAEAFFTSIQNSGASRLVDVRLNNVSQLAGFTKKDDLRYFMPALCGIEYVHLPELAPTQEIIDAARSKKPDWKAWERRFLALMAERRIEQTVPRELIDGACLLCSEESPEHCHRRLAAEYLRDKWDSVEIIHLR